MFFFPLRIAFALYVLTGQSALTCDQVRVGVDARLRDNTRSHYSRYVNWRPADGEVVHLNPPRLSWPYWPDWPNDWADASHTFTLQISSAPDCSDPVVNVTCPFNFYNTVPKLHGATKWYWRVGYDIGAEGEKWSEVRTFTVAEDAIEWDRSALAKPDLAERGHPRILFTKDNLQQIRALATANPESRAALDYMRQQADQILQKPWWGNFPRTDRDDEPKQEFHAIASDLATVCFVWRMTGDAKYAGVKERAVTWASYPAGGRASPEGLGGDGGEDATQGNEFLALLFDWLYNDLNDEQRQVMIKSLEWRIDHWMNWVAWHGKRREGPVVRLTFRKGKEQLSDQRLYLRAATEWQRFNWSQPVPDGATSVVVELFNYYSEDTVWWDRLAVHAGQGEPNLIRNADFAQLDQGQPVAWFYTPHGTRGRPVLEKAGGRERSPAAGIRCPSTADRGSFGQTRDLDGARRLHVVGWYRTEKQESRTVRANGLSGMCGSHQYEGAMDTAVCGLAAYEHSPVAREWFDLILNYMVGVTCAHGFDEAWNEGFVYGISKFKWLTNATMYFDTALPEAHLGRNPFYKRIGDWFCRVMPVGMDHHAWGNGCKASRDNHLANMRKLAHLTREGRFLLNWQQDGGSRFSKFRPWIEYVLPHYYQEPKLEPEHHSVAIFPIAGWGMAASGPPSLRNTYDEGIGLVLQCRPRGGYGHSFHSDGSFQLHAYGEMLNHGGGSSANKDAYAYHTMSHNTILVDGLGQAQPGHGQLYPAYGRLVGFARGKQYVYFAADATRCYPKEPGNYSRWGLPLHGIYQKRALPHLERFIRHILFVGNKYFVIYDDLLCSKPATFTWLYHILPDDPIRFDQETFAVDYTVGDVAVRLQHLAQPGKLELDDREKLDAFINPITGEDYRRFRRLDILCGHNLWISNTEPVKDWRFLAVVFPVPPGGKIPAIERIDDATVRVGEDILCFDPASAAASQADVVVDVEAFR